jgi:hypothetical protein
MYRVTTTLCEDPKNPLGITAQSKRSRMLILSSMKLMFEENSWLLNNETVHADPDLDR